MIDSDTGERNTGGGSKQYHLILDGFVTYPRSSAVAKPTHNVEPPKARLGSKHRNHYRRGPLPIVLVDAKYDLPANSEVFAITRAVRNPLETQ